MRVTEITAQGLSVSGGDDLLLRGLDLHVRAGEVHGVTGPSGSGKTALLYAISGLIPAASGRLLVDGRPTVVWRDVSAGLILQNLALVPLLTAQETVALPLQAKGIPRAEVEARSATALSVLGLAEHTAQQAGDLSGGQRQRVAIARVLAGRPDVILADEPTSALDTYWRQVVLDLLIGEARRGGVVVVASSDAEVIAMCDRVLTLG